MRSNRTTQADLKQPVRVSRLILCAVLGAFASGCVALAVGAAGGVAGAVYVMGKLKDDVNHDVPTVHAATVAAMKDLDLKVSEDKADKMSAHLESEFADGKHVWIDLESIPEDRTTLTIRVGLMGDEMRARKIHEAIKRHLPSSAQGRTVPYGLDPNSPPSPDGLVMIALGSVEISQALSWLLPSEVQPLA